MTDRHMCRLFHVLKSSNRTPLRETDNQPFDIKNGISRCLWLLLMMKHSSYKELKKWKNMEVWSLTFHSRHLFLWVAMGVMIVLKWREGWRTCMWTCESRESASVSLREWRAAQIEGQLESCKHIQTGFVSSQLATSYI